MRCLVSFSGGMDSATLLARAVRLYGAGEVAAVGFRYPSKHNPYERAAAAKFCQRYGVLRYELDATALFTDFRSDLLASGGAIPLGHYEAASMSRTVVPGRNLIFAAALAGLAESLGAAEVWLGVHAGDHHVYPDCRPGFVQALQNVVFHSTEGKVDVQAPFLHVNKTGILKEGLPLGVPYDLTRTCYQDQEVACGQCGSCRERLAAFKEVGVEDPLVYIHRHQNPGDANA